MKLKFHDFTYHSQKLLQKSLHRQRPAIHCACTHVNQK